MNGVWRARGKGFIEFCFLLLDGEGFGTLLYRRYWESDLIRIRCLVEYEYDE